MESRRGGRPSQVRPRPSSNGRPGPAKVRPVAPSPTRLARYRRIERRRGLPWPAKLALALSVAVLGVGVLWIGSGGVGPFVSSMISGFGGFVSSVGSTVSSQAPTSSPEISGSPSIVAPDQPYTNLDTVDVTVRVPAAVVGLQDYTIRLWVTLKDKPPAVLGEVAVGPTSEVIIPGVQLSKGRNDLQASIVGPAGESELSTIVTWVLDTSKPKISIISPKDGAAINAAFVTVKGKTQAGSTVRLRNDVNSATTTVDADTDGLFQAAITVGKGLNTITITATDPAGNANTATLTVRKGSGKLTIALSGTTYRFKASKLPKTVSFTVVVTSPDGKRVSGATALFTVTVPGLEAIVSSEIRTNANGTATFTTSIPKGAMKGTGLASVLVTTADFGTGTDREVLTVE